MYKLMHKNDIVAFMTEGGAHEVFIPELMPECLKHGAPLSYWLQYRSIDRHRSHSRQLAKMLRISNCDDLNNLINVGHAVSITDNWWIQSDSENLVYRDLKEFNEHLAEIALTGSGSSESYVASNYGYTELGTVGSYEKCWKFKNDNWYMYKQGSFEEQFSEYYAVKFLESLGYRTAEYEIYKTTGVLGRTVYYTVTKDFTENAKYDFEMFCNYFGDNDDEEFILSRLPDDIKKDYAQMVLFDAVLFNIDRHNQNVGLLRNSNSGEIIGLAPWFDYNLSLVSTNQKLPEIASNNLVKSIESNKILINTLKNCNFPSIDEIKMAIDYATAESKKAFVDSLDCSSIENYIINTYQYIYDVILR